MTNRSNDGDRKVTRRTVLKGLGAGVAVAFGSSRAVHAAPTQMIMATGGGKLDEVYRQVVFTPFKEKTGINIVTTGNEGGRLKAMVEQKRVEWDLMQGPAEGLVVFGRQGLFEPIDYKGIDRSKLVPGSAFDTFVLTDFAAYCIAWNTKNVTKNPPKDWAALWALDGRIGLWKRPFQTLEVALLADGVPLKSLYPLNLDRAFASLDKIKKKLVWWNTGAQGGAGVSRWRGRRRRYLEWPSARSEGGGCPCRFPLQPGVTGERRLGNSKGAPNKAEAMQMLAYALSPVAQAAFSKAIPYGPVNTDALALLDDKTKAALPTAGPNKVILNVDYWAENGPSVVERFNKWVLV